MIRSRFTKEELGERWIYNAKPGIVDMGTAFDLPYVVITFGSHPCAYVAVQPGHPVYGKSYYDNPDMFSSIKVHGGVTFTNRNPCFCEESDLWWVGWDYNHYGDYNAKMVAGIPVYGLMGDPQRMWMLPEIYMDIRTAARRLKEMEK